MPDDEIEEIIARELDKPSLYMGGASPQSRRKARHIIEALRSNGVEFAADETEPLRGSETPGIYRLAADEQGRRFVPQDLSGGQHWGTGQA